MSRGRPYFEVAFNASPSEFGYYRTLVKPTLESELGVSGRLYLRSDNTTRYHIFGMKAACYFMEIGIPAGKKRDASIPKVIIGSGQAVPFIRGLYHAEGSLYRRYSKQYACHARLYSNLLMIQIRMKLGTLMAQLRHELSSLGIATNTLGSKDGVFTLRITDQGEIAKFFKIVRPRYKTKVAPTIF
ncbi:MAG: hypothetical protein JRM80_03595 [Nitrososphaerota archaeon]|nr:hypothetical protein [Nitrososphaerota archaeon]